MTRSFTFIPELGDNVPYGTEDDSTQGAYMAGHRFGITYEESYGIYFIGTYEPTLGLEGFPWSDEKMNMADRLISKSHQNPTFENCRILGNSQNYFKSSLKSCS